jgi:hypothetical protein
MHLTSDNSALPTPTNAQNPVFTCGEKYFIVPQSAILMPAREEEI